MHLDRTKCCDREFTIEDMQGRLMTQMEALGTNNARLWGGNAKRFAKTQCPTCKMRYIMWLKPQRPNFRVLTLSFLDDEIEEPGDGEFLEPAVEESNEPVQEQVPTDEGQEEEKLIRRRGKPAKKRTSKI